MSKPQGGTLEREPLAGRQQPTTTDLKSPQMWPYGRPGRQAAEPHVDNLQRAHQTRPQNLNFFVYIP